MQSTTAQHGRAAAEPAPPRLKVAYVVSRFPKLTETFVLYEILALQQRGVDVVVFPLLSLRNASTRQGASLWGKLLELVRKPRSTPVMHREAEAMLGLARYHPFLSWSVLRAQWHYVRRRPRAYFGALAALVRGNRRSRRFLLAGLALFPKTVLAARQVEELGVGHVHAHFANHPAAAAFVIGRLTGVPYSFTAHGSDLHVDRSMLAEKVGEAKYVVAISQYNRAMILEECGERFRDRVHVIHCGVDTDVFRPSEQRGEARAESGDGCPERRDGEAGNRTPHTLTTHHSPLHHRRLTALPSPLSALCTCCRSAPCTK